MAMYEMKVETYMEYRGKIHEWYGSELFEADTMEDALMEAMLSEYDEKRRSGFSKVMWAKYEDHATVDWTSPGGAFYEYIEMIERSE